MLITHRTDTAGNLIADDASLKKLTLSSLMATKGMPFVPRRILASVTYASITHAGVVHYADDNNFVVAYILEGNFGAKSVYLDKRVAGTYTTVASASITLALVQCWNWTTIRSHRHTQLNITAAQLLVRSQ